MKNPNSPKDDKNNDGNLEPNPQAERWQEMREDYAFDQKWEADQKAYWDAQKEAGDKAPAEAESSPYDDIDIEQIQQDYKDDQELQKGWEAVAAAQKAKKDQVSVDEGNAILGGQNSADNGNAEKASAQPENSGRNSGEGVSMQGEGVNAENVPGNTAGDTDNVENVNNADNAESAKPAGSVGEDAQGEQPVEKTGKNSQEKPVEDGNEKQDEAPADESRYGERQSGDKEQARAEYEALKAQAIELRNILNGVLAEIQRRGQVMAESASPEAQPKDNDNIENSPENPDDNRAVPAGETAETAQERKIEKVSREVTEKLAPPKGVSGWFKGFLAKIADKIWRNREVRGLIASVQASSEQAGSVGYSGDSYAGRIIAEREEKERKKAEAKRRQRELREKLRAEKADSPRRRAYEKELKAIAKAELAAKGAVTRLKERVKGAFAVLRGRGSGEWVSTQSDGVNAENVPENTAGNTDNDVNMAELNGMAMIPDAELDRMYDDPNLDAETRAQVEAEYDRRTAPTVETGSAGTSAATPVTPINNSATPPPMAA